MVAEFSPVKPFGAQSDMAPALTAPPVLIERRRGRLGELSGERIEGSVTAEC